MAYILEKIYNASTDTSGEPSQGKQSVTTHSYSPSGEQSVITQNRRVTREGRKRQRRFSSSKTSELDERGHRSSPKRIRPSQPETNDNVSIYASDSWDEEEDVRQLTQRDKKLQNTPQTNILDDLAQSLDDDEAVGEKVDTKLADIAQKRWGKKLKPDKLKAILEKYKCPENCRTLSIAKVNPEIWAKLARGKKGNDLQLQYIQNTLLKATLATLHIANALIGAEIKENSSQVITQSVDSIAMLGHAVSQLSQFRRHQIKPALKSEYSAICELEEQTDSKFLFGDDLAKNMKDAKEANQIGNAFKGTTKSFPKNKQSSGDSSQFDRTNYKYSQRPFLGKRQYQNHPKKKNQWQGHQRK